MKHKKTVLCVTGLVLTVIGVALVYATRAAALAEGASTAQTVPFALGLIVALMGIVVWFVGLLPKRSPVNIRTMTTAALFAALCYVGFTYCKLDIPVGTEKTAFHLGNVFCVLAALFLGGFWGGMAGAIGMTVADLTTAYVTSAPKTFLLKLGIGLITGLIAHRVFHISRDAERKVPISTAAVLSCVAGMSFNIIADPLVGYFYKMYVLGVPQQAADIWIKMGAVTTAVNAVIAMIVASILYLAIRPSLKRANLLPRL